ncbi:restriction endonuclease subunit S [Pseudoalteromonas sp. JB197]|uniref:restriction endonuclease subunit S n=1 Tax=Pseudoalteromonas TaxID=53246 RepID=UPI00097E8361|nr:restriction endonuclease subunit S [Pseudoalteromonas sp. JB197]PCC09929.1 restriction endonuclease subunit S [Pseudoalteromonas sp. JB197]SJN41343.1 Type I restriction-modification system, specificity subunit S [Pseudoalteromonas sp. JB197]
MLNIIDKPPLHFNSSVNYAHAYLGALADISTGGKDTKDAVDSGKYPFYVRSDSVKSINSFSKNTEAILTSGDGVGVGKNYHYVNGRFDYHQRVYCLDNFKGVFGKYLYFLFCKNFYKRVIRLSAKNSVDSVRRDMLTEMDVFIPDSIDEQQKIANFLASVDTKISQLTEKHRLLKDYKKGVMQQIFSQKIHFKDDDGNAFPEWNTHELAMLSESGISNGVFNDPKKVGKGFRLINVKDMYKGDSIEYSELTLLDLEPKLFEKNKVKYGDIFFTRSSIVPTGIAFSNVNLSEKEDITFDGHLMKISPNKKLVDPLFLAYYLRSYTPRKTLVSRGKQSTMTTIAQDDIKDIKLNIPALKEQQKIAQFLQSIDKKTSAVNEQIEQTKLFKKGLLQQMFV